MTESLRTCLAHTLPAKSDNGQGQATSPGSRLRRRLPGKTQWLQRGRAGTRARRPDPAPLTVAGPRRIHTDFRAPVPDKLNRIIGARGTGRQEIRLLKEPPAR